MSSPHVGVANGGLSVLDVLGHDRQVVDGVVQTVLGGAQGAADVGHVVDGVLDGVQRSGGAVLTADIQTVNTNSGGVAVINGHIQLVEVSLVSPIWRVRHHR